MSVDAMLAAARSVAESLMQDTCTITRQTGSATDPDTGIVTPTNTTIYVGKCKIQQQAVQSRPQQPGEAYVLLVRREVHLPVASSTGIRAGDLVTVTACANDPDMSGRKLRVRDEASKTYATARRLGVEEVTS